MASSSSSSLLSPSSFTELKDAWHPSTTTVDTTDSSYWFNWRVTICCIWMAIAMVITAFLIFKYEGFRRKRNGDGGDGGEKEWSGNVYEDETWKPCLRNIHPAWLLGFRVVAFFVLLIMLIVIGLVDGPTIFFYYTQWTFALITLYFGLGSLLSLHGCYKYNKRAAGDRVDSIEAIAIDSERARSKGSDNTLQSQYSSNPANIWGYVFQIIFQMNAGAVLLTDCVFWFILVPFLEIHDYSLNVLVINMHSLNAIFLLGDAALNSLSFPCFRIAYFFLWTIIYVLFQWSLHSLVHIWWPYPFLDLSSHYAPLWYFSVAVMHLPCYGAFALLVKLKHRLLQRWFPESYQSPR